MTVAELIERLQTMPPDAPVIYAFCSDWEELRADEVKLLTAEESERITKDKGGYLGGVCYRGGRYRHSHPRDVYPPGESPVYRTVVTFPGN